MSTSSPQSSSAAADSFTAGEFTQRTMLNDLLEQRGLLIGAGIAVAALLLFMRRSGDSDEEQAARRLVRDWRHVDDADDARELLGSNVPVIIRPALLAVLEVIEEQIHQGFRRLERQIERL
jgi:hypothetical protein